METVEVEQKAPDVNAERKADPRNNNAPRSGRRAPQPAANDDNRDRRNRYRRDQDDGPTPVGFGDDIPAFMLIAGKA